MNRGIKYKNVAKEKCEMKKLLFKNDALKLTKVKHLASYTWTLY